MYLFLLQNVLTAQPGSWLELLSPLLLLPLLYWPQVPCQL
jgi:hypothetical protein